MLILLFCMGQILCALLCFIIIPKLMKRDEEHARRGFHWDTYSKKCEKYYAYKKAGLI